MRLPADWQERMAAVVRGAAEPDPAWFTGGPALSPLQQIGVYRQQYRLRIYEALAEEVPGLMHLLGAEAEEILWSYLDAHPPHAWTLNRVADRLPAFLAAFLAAEGRESAADRARVDMVRLDVGVAAVFEAAAGVPLAPERLAGVPLLRLAPHVCLLRFGSDVHHLRSALLEGRAGEGGALPALQEGDWPVVLFRRGIRVRHADVAPELFDLLTRISAGEGLGAALEAVVMADPERLMPLIPGWFQTCGEAGWLQER